MKKVITNAKYTIDSYGNHASVDAMIDGVLTSVPLDPENSDYAAILEAIDAGELTIADAD